MTLLDDSTERTAILAFLERPTARHAGGLPSAKLNILRSGGQPMNLVLQPRQLGASRAAGRADDPDHVQGAHTNRRPTPTTWPPAAPSSTSTAAQTRSTRTSGRDGRRCTGSCRWRISSAWHRWCTKRTFRVHIVGQLPDEGQHMEIGGHPSTTDPSAPCGSGFVPYVRDTR